MNDEFLKDEMYTYHYYRNRCIIRPTKRPDYIIQAAVLCGLAYGVLTLVSTYCK